MGVRMADRLRTRAHGVVIHAMTAAEVASRPTLVTGARAVSRAVVEGPEGAGDVGDSEAHPATVLQVRRHGDFAALYVFVDRVGIVLTREQLN